MLGLALSTASLDMVKIFETNLAAVLFTVLGTALIIYGEVSLVKERIIFVERVFENI